MAQNIDFLEHMNRLRRDNIACDVSFNVGGQVFGAHSAVLIIKIDYFKALLTNPDDQERGKPISLDTHSDPGTFEQILEHIYISNIELTADKLESICHIAESIHYDVLLDQAERFMSDTLDMDNVLEYMEMATAYQFSTLEEMCLKFVIDHCPTDESRKRFISNLSFEQLNALIAQIRDNKEKLSFDFLKQIVSQSDLIRKDNESLNLSLDALIIVSDSCLKEANKELDEVIDKSESRLEEANKLYIEKLDAIMNIPQTESLYAIGGSDGDELSSVSEYNSITRRWVATTPMPTPRSHFGCAVIKHKIYVCCGEISVEKRRYMNELTVFDTLTRTWTELTPMKHERQLPGVAVLNGHIYVAGGLNSNGTLAEMERYSLKTDRWEYVASMITKRSAHELVALNGFLYAIGGHDGKYMLDSVERYDPVTDKWTRMNDTNNNYNAFGSAVLNGHIYIAGKGNCEVYEPGADKWIEMPAPSNCDSGSRLAVYDSQLYATGGLVGEFKNWKGLKTVQVFDMRTRLWRPEPDMNIARCYHGVAVVEN